MEEDNESPKEEPKQEEAKTSAGGGGGGGGGWGGWGFSPLSVLSDLQKAAEEISRNAVEVAGKAAQSLADIQNLGDEESESSSKEEQEERGGMSDKEEDGEDEKRRKSALEKLEKASQDSVLGQGLKVLDHSVENLASGAWQALGNAWRGGSDFVQKLEQSIQHGAVPGGTGPQSILESGKAFTAKGMQVLEYLGKETMDLLIAETGIEVEKKSKSSHQEADEDQLLEEVTFDRCFYIYGGPEQLEELEALSNHYALIFNRRKAKLSPEQKSAYDGKLKLVQQVFDLFNEINGDDSESSKGKKIETGNDGNSNEFKTLHDSSVSKAANMATSFTSALSGLAVTDMIQKTAGRLESLHSEGVHRLSEMCCSAVSHLQMLGKSIISNANKVEEDADENVVKIDWPEDPIEKAKVIRANAQSMTGYLEAVSNSFITDRLSSYFKDQISFARFNYYPPCPAPHLALGVGRHKDGGALTILAQDNVGGLQVGRRSDGEWIPVKPTPDTFIINIGNCVEVWSNDLYWSAEHRVVVNSKKERFSVPLFFFPSHYVQIKPLDEIVNDQNPAKYKEFNWGKFFASRNRSDFKKRDVENIQIDHFKATE